MLGALLPPGTVPQVHFEDRPNYLFAMTCAPDDSETWKTRLMNGQADPQIAGLLGTILGTIHAKAPNHPQMRDTLADTSLFGDHPGGCLPGRDAHRGLHRGTDQIEGNRGQQ